MGSISVCIWKQNPGESGLDKISICNLVVVIVVVGVVAAINLPNAEFQARRREAAETRLSTLAEKLSKRKLLGMSFAEVRKEFGSPDSASMGGQQHPALILTYRGMHDAEPVYLNIGFEKKCVTAFWISRGGSEDVFDVYDRVKLKNASNEVSKHLRPKPESAK